MRPAAPVSGARLALLLGGLALLVLLIAVGSLFIGSARVPPGDVLAVLAGRVKGVDQVVVLSLRLPRIAAALLAGGALAVAGVGFQGLTRNPLAEPSVLGVSSGAAFGVVTAQVFGLRAGPLDALGLTAFAFGGALVSGLGGVIHGLLGNVGPIPPLGLAVFTAAAALGFLLVLGQSRQLNVLALGEEAAMQLGVDAARVKRRIFAGAALLTGAVVAFTGPI